MASIRQGYTTGKNLYILIVNDDGEAWSTDSDAYETYVTANYANYAIAAAELGTASQIYAATLPATLPEGNYTVHWKVRLSTSAAETDLAIAAQRHYSVEETADVLAAALPTPQANYTVSRTTVGAAPLVDITQYQYARFGPVVITAEAAQTGDSHAFLVYSPAAPGTVLWSLTTAGTEISVGGTNDLTITLTDTDAHMSTAGVFGYVLRNTTDDTVVCEGSLTIEERPNVPA